MNKLMNKILNAEEHWDKIRSEIKNEKQFLGEYNRYQKLLEKHESGERVWREFSESIEKLKGFLSRNRDFYFEFKFFDDKWLGL